MNNIKSTFEMNMCMCTYMCNEKTHMAFLHADIQQFMVANLR